MKFALGPGRPMMMDSWRFADSVAKTKFAMITAAVVAVAHPVVAAQLAAAAATAVAAQAAEAAITAAQTLFEHISYLRVSKRSLSSFVPALPPVVADDGFFSSPELDPDEPFAFLEPPPPDEPPEPKL